MTTRIEHDPLGEKAVPAAALYGIQTFRAAENFPISGLRPLPQFVDAVVWIKRSAAMTHRETGRLEARLADAIVQAADEVLGGQHRDQFIVDVYQAGAGTSHNMNVNEVLANRANELLGGERGTYTPVHPNDHVNMAQSTNDVIPTAMRLATLATLRPFLADVDTLAESLLKKGREFDHIVKSGRTHLQDATPIRLGQEFTAFGATVARHREKLTRAAEWLRDLNIGGTAVGTGLNAEPQYPELMWKYLEEVSGLDLRLGEDRIQLMQSMGDIATFSGVVRAFVLDLNKIANDIRLLASGPRTGLAEIILPAVQPGSSIMPGKVNPSIAEMVNQVCYQALGLDTTVAMASEAGQLELNVMMPVITHNVVFSLMIVGNASRVFAERCIDGIEADEKACAYWLERSPALVTALAPRLGYAEAAKLAKEAIATGLTVRELVVKKGLLAGTELDVVLDLRAMTEIGIPGGKPLPGGG
jgi:aspartate ammonia-lyase